MSNLTKNDVVGAKHQPAEILPAWLKIVRDHVDSLKFGTVQVTIHDSRVVQVERVERLRFDKSGQSDGQ